VLFLDPETGPQWLQTLFLLFLGLLLSDFQSIKTLISQPIVVKFLMNIGDNILHYRTMSDFQVNS